MLAKVAITLFVALTGLATADICSPVTPKKNTDGLICDAEGSVARPEALSRAVPITGVNVDRASAMCRNKCLENKNCKSFSFNTNSRSCQIFSRNPAYQGFKAGRGRTFFTDRFCYIQNFSVASGLQNPTFDQDAGAKFLQPWKRVSYTPGGLATRSAPGYKSAFAAKLQVGTSIDTVNSTITQVFNLCPNTTYNIYPYYRFLGQGNSSSYLGIVLAQANVAAGTSCTSTQTQEIPPGPLPNDWAPFPYYNGLTCDYQDIRDSNCRGTKISIIGGQFVSALTFGYSLFYATPNEEEPAAKRALEGRQDSGSPNQPSPPALDQWLVDLIVEKVPTRSPDNEGFATCNMVEVGPSSQP